MKVELIASAKNTEDRKAPVITDIAALEKAIEEVLAMLERVSAYVERVLVCTRQYRERFEMDSNRYL